MLRMLTDRGTEFCGKVEQHDYQLYLAVKDIDHTRTKARHPQTNGIVERFHKTILEEFYQVAFRKKIYGQIDEVQTDLDEWIQDYNFNRTHQGKMCNGRTPWETFLAGKEIVKKKILSGGTMKEDRNERIIHQTEKVLRSRFDLTDLTSKEELSDQIVTSTKYVNTTVTRILLVYI